MTAACTHPLATFVSRQRRGHGVYKKRIRSQAGGGKNNDRTDSCRSCMPCIPLVGCKLAHWRSIPTTHYPDPPLPLSSPVPSSPTCARCETGCYMTQPPAAMGVFSALVACGRISPAIRTWPAIPDISLAGCRICYAILKRECLLLFSSDQIMNTAPSSGPFVFCRMCSSPAGAFARNPLSG